MFPPLISDAIGLATVVAEPRAVAFLTVPWSGPERIARAAFLPAAEQLASPLSSVRVPCYLIDEHAELCLSWLASLGVSALGSSPRGYGSVLWLAEGRLLSFAINGQALESQEIVAGTRAVWDARA